MIEHWHTNPSDGGIVAGQEQWEKHERRAGQQTKRTDERIRLWRDTTKSTSDQWADSDTHDTSSTRDDTERQSHSTDTHKHTGYYD